MGPHDPSPSGRTPAPGWMDVTLAASSDLVVVIDPTGIVTWCSPSSVPLLGIPPSDAIGRSLGDFLHPDDIERAVEVMALVAGGAFDASPITPALYRVGTEATGWAQIEINASVGPDGSLLIVGRSGGDLVITDRLLEAVTGGEPFRRQAELVLELGRWRYPVDGYVLRYLDEDGVERRITAGATVPEPDADWGPVTPWDVARRTRGEVSVTDLRSVGPHDPVMSEGLARAALDAGFLGCLAAPVHDPSHARGAVLTIWTSVDGPSTAGHRYAMGTMRRALALVLQQRAQLQQLERASRVDQLTGAMSRVRFLEVLDQDHRSDHASRRQALLYVDLDGFKLVNDSLGHGAGDEVLRVAVERISAAVPDGAVVARLGGDEFVVLCPLPDGEGDDVASEVASRVVESMRMPIELRTGQVVVGASIGVAIRAAGDDANQILDAADAALLVAKADGKGRWRVAPR